MQILIPQADEVNIIIDEDKRCVIIAIEVNNEEHSVQIDNAKFVKTHHVPINP
jgi:uncharacterized protein YuzE